MENFFEVLVNIAGLRYSWSMLAVLEFCMFFTLLDFTCSNLEKLHKNLVKGCFYVYKITHGV